MGELGAEARLDQDLVATNGAGPHGTEERTVVDDAAHPPGPVPPTNVWQSAGAEQTWVTNPDAPPSPPVRPLPMGTLGDYELLGELGRGGMGIVYQARQRSLNRLVALKTVLAQSAATPEDVQRFRNEAQSAAQLRHPGIVAVYDVGEAAGCHYYSMEYINGDDLSRLIRHNALPAEQAARYLVQLADAVQYAHEHGVLHRDLKPSNVLVDTGGAVKITDFGLAKRVDADSQLTGAGHVLGTPSYMSPEQAMPTRGPVGPATDVYSLGAVLYELVTCRPPFRAENPLETIKQLLFEDPIPPRRLNGYLPCDLETICLKCLEKEPARRYSSAGVLADELRRFLAGEPILARPLSRVQRLGRWCRRHPRDASLIGAVVAAVVLGLCGVGWQWRRAEVNLTRAKSNFDLLSKASDEMLQVVDEWMKRAPPRAGPQQQRLDSTLQRFEQFLMEEPANTTAREQLAATHRRVAEIRRELGKLDLAVRHYQLAIEQYEKLSLGADGKREFQRQIADTWDSLGDTLREAEQFEAARQAFDTALQTQEELVRIHPLPQLQGDLARTLYNRGVLRFRTGKTAEAQQDYDRAVDLLGQAADAEPGQPLFRQGLARCHINRGVLLKDRREYAAALENYDEAIAILSALYAAAPGENEFAAELAQAHMDRGNLLLTYRPPADSPVSDPLVAALASFEESIRVLRDLSRDYPNVPEYRIQLANGLNGQGAAHQRAGRRDAAQPVFEQARDQFVEVLRYSGPSGDVSSRLGLTLANLAMLIPRDRPAERIPLLLQAVEQQESARQLIPGSPTIPGYLRTHRLALARAQLATGDHRSAAKQAEEIVKLESTPGAYWRETAELFVGTSERCRQDTSIPEADRQQQVDRYLQRAVEALQHAIRAGVVEAKQLAADERWAILRGRVDFNQLVSAAGKR